MTVHAVLFDLDDTLWRVEGTPDWDEITGLQSVELAPHVARLGFDHLDLAKFIRCFWCNWSAANSVPNPALKELKPAATIQETLAEYGVECADGDAECLWETLHNVPFRYFNIRPFPDAISTVEALSAAGYRLVVITNRPLTPKIVGRELRDQGLPEVFEGIVTSGEVGFRKPHPLVFESAIRQLGVQPDEAVVVGDSYENDIVPAAKLGMVPVLKLNGREPDASWVLARYQVSSLAALLQLEVFSRG